MRKYRSYTPTEMSNCLRIYVIIVIYGLHLKYLAWLIFSFVAFNWVSLYNKLKQQAFLLWISVLMTLQVLSASGSIYIHYEFMNNVKERDALTCVTAFLHILTVMTLFTSLKPLSGVRSHAHQSRGRQRNMDSVSQKPQQPANMASENSYTQDSVLPLSESDSRNTGTPKSSPHLVMFMFGTVVVVFVNVVALLAELILKARNGQRTVDLRVILLPTESVFAVCCLALQISAYLKKNRKRIRKDINRLRQLCVCKQTQRTQNSPPHNHENALELLPPVPQPSGS